jgi:SAM-dependent methyltransferase
MTIDYDYHSNQHTVAGAKSALRYIFGDRCPRSLLDVGCGPGTWIRAAMDYLVPELYGVDGVELSQEELLFPRALFRRLDLTKRWDLGRRFDMVLCLEVAEHLAPDSGATLVKMLTMHSDLVVFSGACPGQGGQHHVNCRWPEYWQGLFNSEGYVCDDAIRWIMWNVDSIEPWYRQNIFVAKRAPALASKEARIKSVIHPRMVECRALDVFEDDWKHHLALIEAGSQTATWYLTIPIKASVGKLMRKMASVVRWNR